MKRMAVRESGVCFVGLLLLLMPAMVHAQSGQAPLGPPQIAAPLVREGDFAVELVSALGVGTTQDEVEAETRLGEVGIVPRNGWIADYPVTPDIVGELQIAVSDAADTRKLSMGKDEALKRFDDVVVQAGLSIVPHAEGKTYEGQPPGAENYPNPAVINDYYYNEGAPVVTYYVPPPAYYYLYAWVPYPFWCCGFWYSGFFVLRDFHRVVVVHNRALFVSNHFNAVSSHNVFRVDPVARFNGRTFAGIGARPARGFIATGIPRSDRTIFNAPRTRTVPSGRMASPPRGGGMVGTPSHGGGGVSGGGHGGGHSGGHGR